MANWARMIAETMSRSPGTSGPRKRRKKATAKRRPTTKRKRRAGGKAKLVKGSAAAKAHMAKLRRMQKRRGRR